MNHYRATNKTDGTIVEYDAEFPRPDHLTDTWVLEDISASSIAPDAPPSPPPASVKITKLAFRNRFTASEKASIEFACLDNPAASIQSRLMAASLRANQADVAASTFIDLRRQDTRAGVEALEHFGLISPGRARAILDTVPADHEIFNG